MVRYLTKNRRFTYKLRRQAWILSNQLSLTQKVERKKSECFSGTFEEGKSCWIRVICQNDQSWIVDGILASVWGSLLSVPSFLTCFRHHQSSGSGTHLFGCHSRLNNFTVPVFNTLSHLFQHIYPFVFSRISEVKDHFDCSHFSLCPEWLWVCW